MSERDNNVFYGVSIEEFGAIGVMLPRLRDILDKWREYNYPDPDKVGRRPRIEYLMLFRFLLEIIDSARILNVEEFGAMCDQIDGCMEVVNKVRKMEKVSMDDRQAIAECLGSCIEIITEADDKTWSWLDE